MLLVATWLLPLVIAIVDLMLYMARPHGSVLVDGPPVTAGRLMLEHASAWLGGLALIGGVVATGGLWRFRHWAIRLFVAAVCAFAGYVWLCDYVGFRLLPQSALLVQGVGLGGVAAWLRYARDTLPFDGRLGLGQRGAAGWIRNT